VYHLTSKLLSTWVNQATSYVGVNHQVLSDTALHCCVVAVVVSSSKNNHQNTIVINDDPFHDQWQL
jgi:hypothetical protein